eukprot:6204211-Pleurochrysis_carterae.AAC.5
MPRLVAEASSRREGLTPSMHACKKRLIAALRSNESKKACSLTRYSSWRGSVGSDRASSAARRCSDRLTHAIYPARATPS